MKQERISSLDAILDGFLSGKSAYLLYVLPFHQRRRYLVGFIGYKPVNRSKDNSAEQDNATGHSSDLSKQCLLMLPIYSIQQPLKSPHLSPFESA